MREATCAKRRCCVVFLLTLHGIMYASGVWTSAAETSGGLLIALPAANADAFCAEIEQIDGAYVICDGCLAVVTSTPTVLLVAAANMIHP